MKSSNTIKVETKLEKLVLGESIAVNGGCLTTKSIDNKSFTADISPETLSRTNINRIYPGSYVNLEKSMRLDSLVGGHLVMGHVDCVIRILGIKSDKGFNKYIFSLPNDLSKYIIEKGSVALDGVSLTVAGFENGGFSVWVIPETYENTVLKYRKVGDFVNLEVDMMAKYAEKMVSKYNKTSNITEDLLKKEGFL